MKEYDEPWKPRTYLVLLGENDWSDILAPASISDRHPFVVDRMKVIRFRIRGIWYGCKLPKDTGRPNFFTFAEKMFEKYSILFVHPFCSGGYAQVALIERSSKRICYVLCRPSGDVIIDKAIDYVFPYNRSFGQKARAAGNNYRIAMISVKNWAAFLEPEMKEWEDSYKKKMKIYLWVHKNVESILWWIKILPYPESDWDMNTRGSILNLIHWKDIPSVSSYENLPIQTYVWPKETQITEKLSESPEIIETVESQTS